MNHRVKYISFIILSLLWTACSHDAEENTQLIDTVPGLPEGAVGFGAVSKAGSVISEDDYLHNTFIDGKSYLRIYNYTSNTPDFTDSADYKWYVYDEHLSNLTGGQYNFRPMEGRGFIWKELNVDTGSGYKFFAIVFPHFNTYRNSIYKDQNKKENFLASDILMAYHLQKPDFFGKKVSLTFWHVLSMLRVEICLPKYDPQTNTGFEKGAISEIVLPDLYTTFSMDYAQVPTSDMAPTVTPLTTDKDPKGEISMFALYDTEDVSDTEEKTVKGRECYIYRFAAILPVQKIDNTTLLRLKLTTVDGLEKQYQYTPTTGNNISFEAGNITDLQLTFREEENEAFLIKAEIKPWEEATTDMSLEKE
ncbi:fimbrillin family protein [Bacteroides caecimuris]|jgi:hypothetical protein|uniref:fimbrillin family protein n=1 Tax=Bacteroides caecimuris TaxID=1796613 RepID=UPI00242EC50B|nr:fimbrillin family protein [Bacteroides caecimuris]